MRKIRRLGRAGLPLVAGTLAIAAGWSGAGDVLRGRLSILDRGDRPAQDVGQAVVWLVGRSAAAAAPGAARIVTEGKQFVPRITVVTVGSTVSFPNQDPFNHNVFSLTEEGAFDLGLFSRGEARSVQFQEPGIIRIYCNVHAQMSAIVVVRENPHFSRPEGDGSFILDGVPPGTYTLHAWHERAPEVTRAVVVGPEPVRPLEIQMDARKHNFVQHLDKTGRPYSRRGRRY